MQATVSSFDPVERSGAVLLDDGTELSFVGEALTGTGLRLLRAGQRVRVELTERDGARTVGHLQILTLS